MEATLLLAALAQRFHLLVDPAEPLARPGVVLQPAETMQATLQTL
ncbi:hypothetical protein [Streptomyces sp. NPDC059262]